MSRLTCFSRGKIWFVDIGPCKRFDIFQLCSGMRISSMASLWNTSKKDSASFVTSGERGKAFGPDPVSLNGISAGTRLPGKKLWMMVLGGEQHIGSSHFRAMVMYCVWIRCLLLKAGVAEKLVISSLGFSSTYSEVTGWSSMIKLLQTS